MLKRYYTLLIFFLLTFKCFAQGSEFMDSLVVELNKLPGKESQCDRLSEIAFVVINEHPEYAKECAELLAKIAKEINYKKGEAYALYHAGNINYYMDELEPGMNNLTASRKIFKEIGDEKGMGYASNTLGEILTNAGGYNGALKELFDALEHFDKAGSPEGIAWVNNNIGRVHYYQKNYPEALKYFNQALRTADDIRSGDAWLYITFVYIDQEQFTEAEKSVAKALDLAKKNNDQYVLADCYYSLGRIEAFYGKTDLAKEHLEFARNLKRELEDYQGWALASIHLADLYLKLEDPKKALELYREAAVVSEEVGVKVELRDAYLGLSNVFNRLNIHDSAYHFLKLHNDLESELQGEEASKRLAELEANLQAREHQKEIENERKIRDAQQKAAKREKQYMIGGGIVVIVMLLVFIAFMINRNRMKQRANKQLELFNHQITEQKHLIEEKHKEITDSINYAERIQRSFLATSEMLDAHLVDYFVFFRPKDVVSGDFYWASELINGDFAFCCADSTGHGVPGAIMSILNISSLEKSIETETEPHEILNVTRKIIVNRLKKDGSPEGGKDGMDCSLVVINKDKTKVSLAAANNPVFIIRNGEIIEFKGDKMPVGKHDKQDISFQVQSLNLHKNDVIYALTDGFPDQFGGEHGKKFMIKKLKELLIQISPLPMHEQHNTLSDVFFDWRGENEQVDDVCIIGVRV